ncbi:MAG: NAD-glutamate dehydrogenase [Rhodospirillaceae bacterium]|nr:NAD-glutamate dehydrogenase [Rhodospirillaceae bacterium]
MSLQADQHKSELIEQVASTVRGRISGDRAERAETFVRLFYRNVPPRDIISGEPEDLYGAALGLWQFGEQRLPGQPKLRVFNPSYDEHGWHTRHTVVEVVNDDMPFLVDSISHALLERGLTVHLVIHPIVAAERDADGNLVALRDPHDAANGTISESFMHVEVDEQTSAKDLEAIADELRRVLADVRVAVEDWATMRTRVSDTIGALKGRTLPLPTEDVDEVVAFLRWLDDNHFTYLGYREYGFLEHEGQTDLKILPDRGLGILRKPEVSVFEGMRQFAALPPDIQQFMRQPQLLMVTKGNMRSTVHRTTHLDVVIVKSFDDAGEVSGETMFVGLFTSQAYFTSAREIPFLRQKVARAMSRAGFDQRGHDGKTLTHILNTYPRDELFQIDDDELVDNAVGVLQLQERPRTALFVRKDPYQRFVSCMVYIPRDRFSTEMRRKIQDILERSYNGKLLSFRTELTDGVHGRVHYIIETPQGELPDIRAEEVEEQLVEASRGWPDRLRDALIDAKGEERGLTLFHRYGEAFSTAYCEENLPGAAISDVDRLEEVVASGRIGLNLYRAVASLEDRVRFKLYHAGGPVFLSDVLPMLERMGFKVLSEHPYEVQLQDMKGQSIWIHDFGMASRDGRAIDLGGVKELFQDAFERVWTGEMESDGFNHLVQGAGLSWRQVVILRTYGKYLRQARFAFSQDSLEATLATYPDIARQIVRLFEARFDPGLARDRATAAGGIVVELEHALDAVENLDEDRILRRFINLVVATLRTNYYQKGADGLPKPYLSIKLDSHKIDELPLPRPLVEIFVYSPWTEAVHLRGGKVARGGIRWSDRREDFRTEILGLMKAQMVKNTVIVPVGSKGGFVVKRPPREGGREALLNEGIECYRTLMRGMLDVTDNLSGATIVPPQEVVRTDGDDPYLVVAADKGTAAFSDIANAVSQDYGFWLDDAFASGGSVGYDHKKMGITARGAWESVKRHFRELGTDIQTEPFTVVGVGDMSGDVFGNGMLLSRKIRLLAAFNHLHIFLDPDPDPETSFQERERLFGLGRGSWDIYDKSLISPGGGVYDRKAKSIALSAEVRALFGIVKELVTPNELIHALLQAQCDLLWLGGIGTYVKGQGESHAEVGDKANDPLRVNGQDIRARVIGEGANLGLTQRGRIEYARAGGDGSGGRLNTDFIDNSAGVDCSDHEVNIKILLGKVVAAGDMTVKQRNRLLEEMTDEVGMLVLQDNYLQSQAISMTLAEGFASLEEQTRFMKALEKAGKLDRAIEVLPHDEELIDRQGRKEGLNRPELCVIFSYAKITLYDALLDSDLPDDAALEQDLVLYFPKPLQSRFAQPISEHTLRREIIATTITNSMINRTGPTFAWEMMDKTGMGPSDVARAYIIVRDSFALGPLWQAIEALDNKVEARIQIDMLRMIRRLIDRETAWVLQHHGQDLEIGSLTERFRPGVEAVVANLDQLLYDEAREVLTERAAAMIEAGVPEDVAWRVSTLNVVGASLDLIRISEGREVGIAEVASVYFGLGHRLGIAWLRDQAARMPDGSHWQKQAVAATIDDLNALQAELARRVLDGATSPVTADALIGAWIDRRRQPVERIDQLMAELRALTAMDVSMLAVASRRLRSLVSG